MGRVDEIYYKIKNDSFECKSDCPYKCRKECCYKQSCVYVNAMKIALKEMIMKEK